jgi:hypothetical protein
MQELCYLLPLALPHLAQVRAFFQDLALVGSFARAAEAELDLDQAVREVGAEGDYVRAFIPKDISELIQFFSR